MKSQISSEDIRILVIASLTQFTTSFIGSMIPVAIPLISSELDLSIEFANWITISYMIALIAVSVPLSRVILQHGVKKFTIYGVVILIIGLIMSSISFNIYFLLFSRILQGISVAILLISIYLLVVNQIPKDHLGGALGIVGSCGYIGMTSAPTISGFIVYYLSWRILFILMVLIFAIELILLFRVDKEYKGGPKRFNIKSTFLYIVIMTLLMVGLNKITTWGIYPFAIGLISLIVCLRFEYKSPNAILNFNLFRNMKYVIGNYAGFVTYFITFIATYILNFHLQYVLGYDSRIAGMILLITPIVMVLMSAPSGKLADKYDNRILASIAMTILLFVMFALCFIDLLPLYVLFVVLVMQGIGHGLFSPPNNKYVLTTIGKDDLGDASSLLTTSKELGKSFGLAIYNVICIIIIGNQEIGGNNIHELITSSHIIMYISTILTLSAAILLFYSKFHYRD